MGSKGKIDVDSESAMDDMITSMVMLQMFVHFLFVCMEKEAIGLCFKEKRGPSYRYTKLYSHIIIITHYCWLSLRFCSSPLVPD